MVDSSIVNVTLEVASTLMRYSSTNEDSDDTYKVATNWSIYANKISAIV